MSEEAASTPSVIAENGEKSADDVTKQMSDVKIEDTKEESAPKTEESEEQDATSDNARENGDDGFHTPEGTGEEASKEDETKLDDDEIEDNPAYIPRKGRYYMHDSRDGGEEVEEERKASRADGAWKHDRYDERWQRPKTKKQIMTRYGFDIREGDTQEEVEGVQRKRSDEVKKEAEGEAESTGVRSRPKREVRPKPRQRTERVAADSSARPRPQKPSPQKPERQSTEERTSQGHDDRGDKDERVTSERRSNNDDDDDLHVGQRRQIRPEQRRERAERADVRVVRNVRGSRGGLSGHRMDRHPPAKERYDKDRYRDGDGDRFRKDRPEERNYENHRRGAMRGTVRGAVASSGITRGASSRTITATRSSDARESGYQREEVPPQRNAGYSPRDNGSYYDARGGYAPRGAYSGRSRGAALPPPSPRGGYGDAYPTRGFTGPKRYSEQRGEILPPPAQMNVPPPLAPPPPQHNFSMPRQPTDVVYFDPTQQVSRQPLPPREKKIIEIVPPSN